ncbi:MAG: hypothetical protein E7491_01870 [Ruminococcaceae bacterium]|nr:hypothetical protein [Oscillospiraceae bacterium]
MKLLRHELHKILSTKIIYVFFAAALAINVFVMFISSAFALDFPIEAYSKIYSDMENMTSQQALDFLDEKLVILNVYDYKRTKEMFLGMGNDSAVNITPEQYGLTQEQVDKYGDIAENDDTQFYINVFSDKQFLTGIYEEIQLTNDYDAYADEIISKAQQMTGISIFAPKDGFSRRNIEKTIADYQALKGNIGTEFGASKGVEFATNSPYTDIIILIICFYVAVTCVMQEKETGMTNLVKATKKGYLHTAFSKLGAVFLIIVPCILLLYGTNFIYASAYFSMGDLSRPIQSVSGFLASTAQISVLEYFILFFISKIAVAFAVTVLIMLLCNKIGNGGIVFAVIALAVAVETVMFYTIPASSFLHIFKYINIMCFLNGYHMFSQYINVNVFMYPVALVTCFAVVMAVLLILFATLYIKSHCAPMKHRTHRITAIVSKIGENISRKSPTPGCNVFSHELFKLTIVYKTVLVFVLVIIAVPFVYSAFAPSFDKVDMYKQGYMSVLEGVMTEEKEQYIAKENEIVFELSEKYMQAMMEQNTQEVERLKRLMAENVIDIEREFAFSHVLATAEHIRTDSELEFVFDSGYAKLFDVKTDDGIMALAIAACVIALMCPAFACEYESGMQTLLNSTKHRRRANTTKLAVCIIGFMLMFFGIYVANFVSVASVYGMPMMDTAAKSMLMFADIPKFIPIWGVVLILYLIRLSGFIAVIFATRFFAIKFKSTVKALVIMMAVVCLPLMFFIIDVPYSEWFILNPLLLGTPIFA